MSAELSWELTEAIDRFESAVDRKVAAQIDACCCQTSRDWDKLHEAEDEMYQKREALENAIKGALSRSRRVAAV